MAAVVPQQGAQLIDPATGRATPVLTRFFEVLTGKAGAIQSLDVQGSPFVFKADESGFVMLNGGTVTGLQIVRGKTAFTFSAVNSIPMAGGDELYMQFTDAPQAVFVPL